MTDATILTGDCLTLLSQMPRDSAHLIVTSPPYNLGNSPGAREHPTRGGGPTSALRWKGYGEYTDCLPEPDYQDWQVAVLDALYDVLVEGGAACYQHADRMIQGRIISPLAWLTRSRFTIRQQIIWDKGKTHRWDGFYFAPSHEYVFWLTKGKWDNNRHRAQVRQWRSVWTIPPEARPGHPAVFPVALAERCIGGLSSHGDTVLDPFMGSGSTGVACARLGRRFIGMDIDARYCEDARQRISAG